jgi:hypothetical protein
MQSLCALRRNLLWHLGDAGFSGFWASFLLVLCWLPGWNRVCPRHSNHVCTCTPLLGLLGEAYVPDMEVSVFLAFQDKVGLSVRKSALLPYVAHPQCRCKESLAVAVRHSGHILIVVWPYFCTVVLVSSDCIREVGQAVRTWIIVFHKIFRHSWNCRVKLLYKKVLTKVVKWQWSIFFIKLWLNIESTRMGSLSILCLVKWQNVCNL